MNWKPDAPVIVPPPNLENAPPFGMVISDDGNGFTGTNWIPLNEREVVREVDGKFIVVTLDGMA